MGDEMLRIIRENWPCSVKTKEQEGLEHEAVTQPPSQLGSQQLQLIRAMVRGVDQFDPSRCADAWDTWQHLAQKVDVRCLLYTHGTITLSKSAKLSQRRACAVNVLFS